ncbi:MAG: hypothetical protein NZ902_00500 [Acidilobaceae archaeon]|nr:hypothetical protein [Acidilobaceae archaeon]MCX8165315.1 hypothetical protein [Acidilobaceae archaeon]MDW7973741.1 hypothetical protein [Sulfolobales archaeon]
MRVHILPRPRDWREAGRFIANALLLSHGVRRDAEAFVGLEGGWLRARGDRVRHLRPDEESLRGWLAAAVRGSRVGAEVVPQPPYSQAICVGPEGEEPLSVLRRYPPVLSYGEGLECLARARIALPPVYAVIVANVLMDNLEDNRVGGDPLSGL